MIGHRSFVIANDRCILASFQIISIWAINFEPKNADYYGNGGFARNNLRDSKGAIADFDWAIQINPKSAIFYDNRGVSVLIRETCKVRSPI